MKLKEGGYYQNRLGEIVGPLQRSELQEWPLHFHGISYRLDGSQDFARNNSVDKDLIAEVTVTPVLSFELRAGGKYTTQKPDGTAGPVVALRNNGIEEPALAYCFPFAAETFPSDRHRSWYVTRLGQMVRYFEDDGIRITGEYVEPKPPTPIERLEKWRDGARMLPLSELDAIIADLKAEQRNG